MMRGVAVLLCVATSQGIRLQVPPTELKTTVSDEAKIILETAAKEGITYPDVTELMLLSRTELMTAIDDPTQQYNALKLEKTVTKEGDGKTFVEDGDKFKLRLNGILKQDHYHPMQIDAIVETEYPMPMPSAGGAKSPLMHLKDTELLPGMSMGSKAKLVFKDKRTGAEANLFTNVEMELVDVQKKGSAGQAPVLDEKLSPEETVIRTLAKKKSLGVGMNRKVLKEGDNKTFVKPGDIVTMRQIQAAKQDGKTVYQDMTMTYEYPMLAEKYTVKFLGFPIKIKDAADQNLLPEMSLGEMQEISFDPYQFTFGAFRGPKFDFPSSKMELVSIKPGEHPEGSQ